MFKKYCRYSENMMRSLGHEPRECTYIVIDAVKAKAEQDGIKGKFKDIINILFDSTDGSCDNDYLDYVSENAPDSVKSFVQNVLMVDVPSIQGAPDAETAFASLVPRSVQTHSELSPYIDSLRTQLDSYFNSQKSE